MSKNKVQLWTDGGAQPNPGSGAYVYILIMNGTKLDYSRYGGTNVTNNQMELIAVIEGLKFIKEKADVEGEAFYVEVFCDSAYVVNGVNHPNRLQKWRSNGYFTSSGSPLKNRDLWISLGDLLDDKLLKITMTKVKAHSGIKLNERCDELVGIEIELNKQI